MSARKPLSRRGFLKIAAGTGAGLVLGCYARPLVKGEAPSGADLIPSAWLRVRKPLGFDQGELAKISLVKPK